MTEKIAKDILKATGANRIVETELIQELWSGYGEILRCTLEGAAMTSVVVKHVQLPTIANHPRGWNTNLSHERKRKSYQVEMNWYSGLAKSCNESCRIPGLYYAKDDGEELLMIMEDLNASGYPKRKSTVSLAEIKICLQWMAHFHAQYIHVVDDKLWEIGSYWHLATRPDELDAMQDKDLKAAAPKIDQVLNEATYQTLIHGDAKLANFCFSKDGTSVAAVDFQYIGRGCGMKDVAYFLSSCLAESELFDVESTLLEFYFEALSSSLEQNGLGHEFEKIKEEWSSLYPFAWTDFYRFLDGWSPGHWKMNTYAESMRNKVLSLLD